jgi:hypothetical protein
MTMKQRLFSLLLTGAMLLSMCPPGLALEAEVGQAGADAPTLLADNVPYLDADGSTNTRAAATEVTSGDTAWSNDWYVVSGDVTILNPVTVTGDVHLILENGCTLNAEQGIVISNASLSIYAQSVGQNMGKLTARNDSGPKSIAIGPPIGGKGFGHITICGGHITATAVGEGSCGILIGDLDIYNGTVAATGNQYGIYGLRDYVSIRNGTVKATATDVTGYGIYLPDLDYDMGGAVIIEGGTVTATGGANGSGICVASPSNSVTISGGTIVAAGGDGIRGNFTTEEDGNAFITASSIEDDSGKIDWHGVIFEGGSGQIYGSSIILGTNAEIPNGKTLTIEDGQTLTIHDGVSLSNNGTIIVEPGGKLVGDVSGSGTVNFLPPPEQFHALTPGETYWFDLSEEKMPGWANSGNPGAPTPDTTLHWVPFIYAGTIRAYVLNSSSSGKTEASVAASQAVAPDAQYGYTYDHSLFVSDYSVVFPGMLDNFDSSSMLFGKSYTSGCVDYTLRAPSMGSNSTNDNMRGTPQNNEWDVILDKNADYIKNWNRLYCWGQDTHSERTTVRAGRGYSSARNWTSNDVRASNAFWSFRPVLEILNPDTLTADGLKVVTLDLNGGKAGTTTTAQDGPVNIVVKSGGDFTAPSGEGLTAPDGKVFGGWKSGNVVYQAGDNVPGTVTALTAYWFTKPSIITQPEDKSVSVGEQATFTAAASGEPSPDCKWQVSRDNGGRWEDISGATGSSYTTETATMSMDGWQYRYFAANSAGNATSNAAMLTVTPSRYTITATAGGGGSVTGGGTYAENTSVTVTATAINGYHFVKWTEDGREVSTDASYIFVAKGDRTLVAVFEQDSVAPPDPGHTHVWATVWSRNTTHHWRECTALGCDLSNSSQKDGYALHTSGGWIVDTRPTSSTPGQQHKECTTCGQITQTEAIPATGGGGGGGGSYTPPGTPAYPPTVERPSGGGGIPSASPSNPKQGDTVTVTPKPDDGCEVDKITVTDRNGKPVEVTKKPDGTYTFKQPNGKVKIEVSYKAVEKSWNNPFTDVSESDWYYEAVRFVQERGLMNGYSDGRFGANDTLSRAQLAQILFNKEGRPVVNYLLDFSDVAGEAWYTEAIRWATNQGIVGGYGNGTFGPNDPITREQLAVMLWQYSGSPAATNKELHFNDESEISGFSLEAMRWAVENRILNGDGDGRLGPQGQATRAQVAQMLKNFIENQETNT